MAIYAMIFVFVLGYLFIATEHKVNVNKAATALVMSGILWVIYIFSAAGIIPSAAELQFQNFLHECPDIAKKSFYEQVVRFVVDQQVLEHLGETTEVLMFLIGAMTIVDVIDYHGGFSFITDRITTRNKVRLLWIIAIITFFLSALLDNMTTTIIMVMLLRKLVADNKERWLFASIIIIAANSGGAWSPIGDVTTIMLWVKGNVTTFPLIKNLILPSFVSMVIPVLIASRILKGTGAMKSPDGHTGMASTCPQCISKAESLRIFILGVTLLVLVPVFKSVTNLPPYMGVLTALGIMWVYTEIMYSRMRGVDESLKYRVSRAVKNIDMPTILFFMGILMSVAALQSAGILSTFSEFLDNKVHNVYAINTMIGLLSSIVDNVPLVAGAIGMYPVLEPSMVAATADPVYMQAFVQDGTFWLLLAYCAGVGGSILIIGSAAGVVAMGLEKMNFMWYLKNISLIALAGYLAGIGVYILQSWAGLM